MISAGGSPVAKSELGAVAGLVFVSASLVAPALGGKAFTEEEVSAALTSLISARSKDGVYTLRDPKTDASFELVFESIRVVRGLEGHGWFPDAIFHAKDTPQKKYAVDFWLKPDGDQLKLMDVRIHKDPRPDGKSWMTITRTPLLWWWLPTLERSSAVRGKQAWEVIGAIHEHVVGAQTDSGFPFVDASGKSIPLELVEFYQPVGRSRKDGRYFACADFRKIGSPSERYAITFWLEPEARTIEAGRGVVHEDTRQGARAAPGGTPCRFDEASFDVVE
jgi:hypothetical protein